MFKKILEIVTWLMIIAFLVVSLGFASSMQKAVICKSVMISITDNTANRFVSQKEILELLKNKGIKLTGANIDKINISEIEKTITNHPAVKKANAFRAIDGTLHIDIEQRRPIIRIVKSNSESFYIDDQGRIMPLSDKYTARVVLANGKINEPFFQYYHTSFSDKDEIAVSASTIQNLVYLANYIDRDPFWHSQIVQIYVNERGEFELIPLVGKHIILLGSFENYQKKFRNLRAVYEKGFSKTGWNIYKTINLKFDNQVVCTRADSESDNLSDTLKNRVNSLSHN